MGLQHVLSCAAEMVMFVGASTPYRTSQGIHWCHVHLTQKVTMGQTCSRGLTAETSRPVEHSMISS